MKKIKNYDKLFVLGAEIVKKTNDYIFPDVYKGMALAGELRLKVAAKLFEVGKAKGIVCVSGAMNDNQSIQKSAIMKDYLVKKYKIPDKKIETLISKPDTRGNISLIKTYIKKEKILPEKCAFLTNFYHIPRAIKYFYEEGISILPISAESVLLNNDKTRIKEIYNSKYMLKRILFEIKGLE